MIAIRVPCCHPTPGGVIVSSRRGTRSSYSQTRRKNRSARIATYSCTSRDPNCRQYRSRPARRWDCRRAAGAEEAVGSSRPSRTGECRPSCPRRACRRNPGCRRRPGSRPGARPRDQTPRRPAPESQSGIKGESHPRRACLNSSCETSAWRSTPASVPPLIGLCIGTTQPFDSRRIMTWLPLWRIFANPRRSSARITSAPDTWGSLGMRRFGNREHGDEGMARCWQRKF